MSDSMATRAAYGKSLVELGKHNDNIVVLDADLSHATMTTYFAQAFPKRFFNIGIAEANMVCMAAGMASVGWTPFISTFAIFGAGRAYEQIRNAIGYTNANVKLAFTHAGITVGEDGGSHQSIEDIALMRAVPHMVVLSPCDRIETYKAVQCAYQYNGPVYIRLSRMECKTLEEREFQIGKANVLREGVDLAIFATGIMVHTALEVAEELEQKGISIAVVNIHTIKPLDIENVIKYSRKCRKVITLEEHSVIGGLGDAVLDALACEENIQVKKIGIKDQFGQSGKPSELLKFYRLDKESIAVDIKEFINQKQ